LSICMFLQDPLVFVNEQISNDGRSDAEDTKFVYEWRLQQEAALRASKGVGMTDEEVINFVNGCKCQQVRSNRQ